MDNGRPAHRARSGAKIISPRRAQRNTKFLKAFPLCSLCPLRWVILKKKAHVSTETQAMLTRYHSDSCPKIGTQYVRLFLAYTLIPITKNDFGSPTQIANKKLANYLSDHGSRRIFNSFHWLGSHHLRIRWQRGWIYSFLSSPLFGVLYSYREGLASITLQTPCKTLTHLEKK